MASQKDHHVERQRRLIERLRNIARSAQTKISRDLIQTADEMEKRLPADRKPGTRGPRARN